MLLPHYTIAHITVLLVALTAVKSGNQEKSVLLKNTFRTFNFINAYIFTYLLK